MNWIIIAITAYFFLALSQVLDKFLLSDRIPKPSIYAFYVALLSLASLVLAPFGFYLQSYSLLAASLISGTLYIYAILFLYKAVRLNEISRIAPLVGSILALATLFISSMLSESKFSGADLSGIFFLLAGGFLISFDLPIKSMKIFSGFNNSLISGLLFAAAYAVFKYVYQNDIFINGFIWTRLGLFLGGLSLLLAPAYRQEIRASFKGLGNNKKRNLTTGLIFVGNKVLGGSHSVLIQYAIYLGSTAIVNALNSVQFVFVLILASLASIRYPGFFGEKLYFWDWAQKFGAIILIGAGIVLVSV